MFLDLARALSCNSEHNCGPYGVVRAGGRRTAKRLASDPG